MRHIPGPAILQAAVLAATLALAGARPAAASMDLDWQVSLSGAVALAEVRFGKVEGWTCSTGSLTATAANGTCTESAERGWLAMAGTAPPPVMAFMVKPTFPVHLPDSPTGIPGAPVPVSCAVPADLKASGNVDYNVYSPGFLPDMEVDGPNAPNYCNHLTLDAAGGNAWILTYSGPTTSEGVMQD